MFPQVWIIAQGTIFKWFVRTLRAFSTGFSTAGVGRDRLAGRAPGAPAAPGANSEPLDRGA